MSDLKILIHPHPVLKYETRSIKKIDSELKKIVREMFDVMYATEGIGLAANQVGLPYRLFVMNTSADPERKEDEHVFINPVIQKKKGSEEDEEGCLSFPDIRAPVVRPAEIVIEGVTLDGQLAEFTWKGLAARAAQHEFDHLNGISFVDRVSVAAFADIREKILDLEYQFETDQRLGIIPSKDQIIAGLATLIHERC